MNTTIKVATCAVAAVALVAAGVLLAPWIQEYTSQGPAAEPVPQGSASGRTDAVAPANAEPRGAVPSPEVATDRPEVPPVASRTRRSTPPPTPQPPDRYHDLEVARGLARKLVSPLPAGARIALRTLVGRADGLPPDVGHRLYETLLEGIDGSVPDDVKLIARERLSEVSRSREEFDQGDIETLLHNAQADVEIICKPFWDADGVLLSCAAIRLADAVTLATGSAHFEQRRDGVVYDIAISDIARRLEAGAPGPGRITRVFFQDAKTGSQTDLGQASGERLTNEFAALAERRVNAARAADVLGGESASTQALEYQLRGLLRTLDANLVRLEVHLKDAASTTLVSAGADVALASIPELLRPGPSATGAPTRRYEGTAEAIVSDRLDEASARRAARNLARARVIAQAMGIRAPDVAEVSKEVDAMRALGEYLSAGITVDEEFHDMPGLSPPMIRVRLLARVVPVGTAIRPPVSAKLGKEVYKELEPMSVEIGSEASAHLGVFSWAADNKVVRLYPSVERTSLAVGADDVVTLPGKDEPAIKSFVMPPPTNLEDHEALVVVAAAERLDFMGMAPDIGWTADETMQRSIDGSEFLSNLAAGEPGQMAVLVLPYLVHR